VVGLRCELSDFRLEEFKPTADTLQVTYRNDALDVEVTYTLRQHFVEKRVAITSRRDYGLKRVVLSQMSFPADDLEIVCYRQPDFGPLGKADPFGAKRPRRAVGIARWSRAGTRRRVWRAI